MIKINKDDLKNIFEDSLINLANDVKNGLNDYNYEKFVVPQIEKAIAALLEATQGDEYKCAMLISRHWNIAKSTAMRWIEEYNMV